MTIPDDPGRSETGYPSSFTQDQLVCLREVWRNLLAIIDGTYKLDDSKTSGGKVDAGEEENVDTGKGAFKGQAKDDKEKKKQRRDKERKLAEQILKTVSPEDLRETTWRSAMADHPDSLIARFCRARGWEPEAAFAMLGSSVAWRHQMKVPELLEAGEFDEGGFKSGLGDKPADAKEAKRFMKQYHDNKSYCLGTDRAGRPMGVINVKTHTIGGCSSLSLQRYVIMIIEMLRTALVPPAEEGTVIFNMEGFGLRNWDFYAIKLMIDVFASYYPQTIYRIIVYRQPFYFWPFYKFVEPFLPAEIRDKVVFAANLDELLQYVDAEHLPEDMGGKAAAKGPYKPPTKNDETKKPASDAERKKFFAQLDKLNKAYEDATRKWIKAMDDGCSQKEEDKILDERDAIQARRYALCRKGDPLWRATTEIARLGYVREYGRTCWTYEQQGGSKPIVEKWGRHSHKMVRDAPPLPKKLQKQLDADDDEDDESGDDEEEDEDSGKAKRRQKRRSKENGSAKKGSSSKRRQDDDEDDEEEEEEEEDE